MSIISLITGNETPVGQEWVDDRMEEGQQLVTSAVEQVKAWSVDDPDTWTDDALRWAGGAIKATGNWWQEATADKEGIGDDILRGVGGTVGLGVRALDAGSYYGGEIGGRIASFIGFDSRIGGAIGNVTGDVLAGGILAKAGKTAKIVRQLDEIGPIASGRLVVGGGFGAAPIGPRSLAGKIKAAAFMSKGKSDELTNLIKGVDQYGDYLEPIGRWAEGKKGTRTGGVDSYDKSEVASLFQSLEETQAFKKAVLTQTKGSVKTSERYFTPWAHHHIVDHDIAGQALNRMDAPEIDRILKEKGIRLGNDERNLIASAHYKPEHIEFKAALKKLRPDLSDRVIDDLLKNEKPFTDPATLDNLLTKLKNNEPVTAEDFARNVPRGEINPPNIGGRYTYGAGPEQYPGQMWVERWRMYGIDRKQLKIDPQTHVIGRDHTGVIHEAYKKLPSNQRLREAFKTGEYWYWPPEKAAQAIIDLTIDQRNISLNVSKWRLNLIKEAMGLGTANGLKFKPNTNWRKLNAIQGNISTSDFIKEWVKANPATSVQLGWLDNPPTLPELMSSHGKVTKEIIDVFTYKQ